MNFQDHFSRQAEIYLKARPTYPDELFQYLSSITPAHELCWDCATGNGQAAISLAKHYKKVIATDASKSQIENAIAYPNVEYRVAAAEQGGVEDSSVDLITVATAAHWFEHDSFYAEAQRVTKPGGILAIWTYSEAKISKEIDELMEWYMYDFLLDYWPDGRWYVRNKYETLPFPFEQMATPDFYCRRTWNLSQWLDYMRSWSSYNNYLAKEKTDPLPVLLERLQSLWREEELKDIAWKLHLKCAKMKVRNIQD